jgi:hypothetical protein
VTKPGFDGKTPEKDPLSPPNPVLDTGSRLNSRSGARLVGETQASELPTEAGRGRVAYLETVTRQLWPEPAKVSTSSAGPDRPASRSGPRAADEPAGHAALETVSEFIVLPGLRRPRLLVPVGRPAATAVRRYGMPSSIKTRLGTQGLSLLLRSGLGPTVLRDRLLVQVPAGTPTIESYLSEVLGRDIVVSLYLGPPRANRKPILQLLTPGGKTFGYAKVGVNALTRDLVETERDALIRLSEIPMSNLTVPRVIHYGACGELTVLVLSALPVWLRRRMLLDGHLTRAMIEVASLEEISARPLLASTFWQQLVERLAAADATADRAALFEVIGDIATRAGDATLSFGASHGDWAPWNMARTSRGLLVWDWERFRTGVPVGFDALHYWLQARLRPGRHSPLSAASDCLERAPSLLAPFGIEAAEAVVTSTAYLADLATRYLVDRQAEAGSDVGRLGEWLIPPLAETSSQL